MGLTDASTPAAVKQLNGMLTLRSYLEGYAISAADTSLFATMAGAPDPVATPHAFRWYIHVAALTGLGRFGGAAAAAPAAPAAKKAAPAKKAAKAESDDDLFGDDDDEDDLFDDDDDDTTVKTDEAQQAKNAGVSLGEIRKLKAAALAKAAKSMKKITRTQLVFEVKPWEAECDLSALHAKILKAGAETAGLKWGEGFNLVDVAFGIKKLICQCIVEDDKVGVEDITDQIEAFEDDVQSVDMIKMTMM
jgi:translation elongation factor EF-1beta